MTLPASLRPAIVLILGLASATAKADSLYDIYKLALGSDPQLQQAEAGYLAVQESKNQSKSYQPEDCEYSEFLVLI